MGLPIEFSNELRDIIKDVNYKEITSNLVNGTLKDWIESWAGAANRAINNIVISQNKTDGWIPLTVMKPREEVSMQLLIADKDDDLYPTSYVMCGFLYNDVWFAEGCVIHDKVVAWKPLDKEVDFKKIVEWGWIE